MNWYYGKNNEVHCIQYYNITIISDDSKDRSIITNESSTTIPSLIIGTNYSFIIIPIDTIGREGPPSSLIQYIWNGKYYTHTCTHSLYFLQYQLKLLILVGIRYQLSVLQYGGITKKYVNILLTINHYYYY